MLTLLAGSPLAALAAPGAVIGNVVLPSGVCSTTSIATVPGAAVGFPADPVLLVTTCNTSDQAQASKLYFIRPTLGPTAAALVLTVTTTITPSRGWGSLAMRTDKGDLLACANKDTSVEGSTHEIYRIPLSPSFATTPTTAPVKLFDGQPGFPNASFCDGIAWDTVDNRIYQSPDVFPTIYRFTESGQSEGTISVPSGCNNGHASGVSVSGQNLYIGCANDPEIYRVDKHTGVVLEFFGSPEARTEDLECDPFTFAAQQKDVIWTKDLSDNKVNAVEVARGTCGGAPPVAVGPLCSSTTDTDGDGLLDCWEKPSPTGAGANGQPCIDFDGDGTCDLALCVDSGDGKGVVCANPYRKDVFVEIDWLDGHGPLQTAITRVINRFDAAPVTNPVNPATGTSVPGIRLHVLMDEALKDGPGATAGVISHIDPNTSSHRLLAFEPYTAVATGGVLDFDQLKKNNFGTATQRGNPKALNAKRQAFRYMIFAHLLVGLGGTSGAAEVHGNDGVVTLGAGASGVGSEDQQAGTFFHELGHLLGLRHGGADKVNCKPNYLSIMNYTRQFPGSPISTTQWQATALNFSTSKLPDLNKSSLIEKDGVIPGGIAGDVTVQGQTATAGIARSTAGEIDWDRDGGTDRKAVAVSGLNEIGDGACPSDGTGVLRTLLAGHNDWANLKYDVRASLDIADGNRFSLADKERELGFRAPPDNPCTAAASCPVVLTTTESAPGNVVSVDSDGDGVPDLEDNCPTVANGRDQTGKQADSDGDGIGDACPETRASIDIKPGRYPNIVDLLSTVPLSVAILSGSGFDATQVSPNSVDLSGAKVLRRGNVLLCDSSDANGDGIPDLVCTVDKRDLVLASDSAVALLTARTQTNVLVRGEDSIHIVRGTGGDQ